MADATLGAALAADLDCGFERLVLEYQDRVFGFALRLTGNASDAEEIAQDAFVRAYRALCGYPPDRIETLAIKPWLYQIALNVLRNRVRGRRLATVPIEHNDGSVLDLPDHGEQPDQRLERTEREQQLSALLLALPDRYRTAVVLRHVQGFGYGELATMLDQPVGTVKANVHRGVQMLRAALQPPIHEVC